MKLTCPECFSEFEVPDNALGPSGRRVRCHACARVWFQDPSELATQNNQNQLDTPANPTDSQPDKDQTSQPLGQSPQAPKSDDILDNNQSEHSDTVAQPFSRFDDGMAFDPIPPSLHPQDDEDLSHSEAGFWKKLPSHIEKQWFLRFIGGFVVSAALFALFLWLGALVGLHKGVLKPFYAPFGIVYHSSSVALAIEGADANVGRNEQGELITDITGVIRNTGEVKVVIPLVEISILSEAGVPADSSYIKLETETLSPGEAIGFEARIPSPMSETEKLRIRFVD